jgi:hypothetical protein
MTHLFGYANIVLDAAAVLSTVQFFIERIWLHEVLSFLMACVFGGVICTVTSLCIE